jgi:hypothetical protein
MYDCFSQLPHKFHLEEVASVRDCLKFALNLTPGWCRGVGCGVQGAGVDGVGCGDYWCRVWGGGCRVQDVACRFFAGVKGSECGFRIESY